MTSGTVTDPMEPIPSIHERCVRRSRARRAILIQLSSLTEAYAGQLARMVGIERKRAIGALVGDGRYYSKDLSLVGLRLATVHSTPKGRVFRITAAGRRKARSIVAAMRRRTRGNARFASEAL